MLKARSLAAGVLLASVAVLLPFLLSEMMRFSSTFVLPLLWTTTTAQVPQVDLNWHPPNPTWINSLPSIINGTGSHGFIYNGSQLPPGIKYGTYNWCNMPHVRQEEYPSAGDEYELKYVEVIHRHHKRTPYAANTFPTESYGWDCSDEALFFYGQPQGDKANRSASTYWKVYRSDSNPFAPNGFNGTCQFPQITRGGLDDSFQHGKDLYGVYHDMLDFLPEDPTSEKVRFRVTNNVITSEVAGMLLSGMYGTTSHVALSIQPAFIDSLEPQYPCPAASKLYQSYGVGSSSSNWTRHLSDAKPLFSALDAVSGISPTSSDWHQWFDHYMDNLSARQCHAKPLPCALNSSTHCISQREADAVYRLGQYEYSFIHRDSPLSLTAAVGAYGVWVAELAQNLRDIVDGHSGIIYRHNVAHDGSMSRLLSILQVDMMVWPGMGAEVVFELYQKKSRRWGDKPGWFVRVLWGGQTFRSSNPSLGALDMVDVNVLLAYLDGLVGRKAQKVVEYCSK